MNTFKRQFLLELLRLFDLLLLTGAFLFALAISNRPFEWARFDGLVSMRISVKNLLLFGGLLVCWHLILCRAGVYDSRRFSKLFKEIRDLGKGVAFCTIMLFLIQLVYPIAAVTLVFLQVFLIAGTILLVCSRLFVRLLLGKLRKHGMNLRHVLIVGTNRKAIAHAERIRRNPELGYVLRGFVDDTWAPDAFHRHSSYHIVSKIHGISAYLRENVVDEVHVYLPINDYYDQIQDVIKACEEQGILVRMKTDLFKLRNSRVRVENLGEELLLTYCTGGMRRRMLLIKKTFDVVGAAALLALFSPLFLFTAIAIKLTSAGPVFFAQERLGFNKRRFRLYKFRTMVPDAEKKISQLEHLNEMSGPVFKVKNDPRLTRVGRMLRKFSIDELPQLFNVLKGEMSLVGPRPLPIRDCKGFNTDWHRRRFCVKPGLTCLWQVSGRNNVTFEQWMEMDMFYIDNWSPTLDFKILLKTVPAVFTGHGAS